MSLLYRFKPLKDELLRPVLSVLRASGVTPNMVTVLGVVLSAIAALLAASGHAYVGLVLFMAGASLDALDGSLARFSGRCTEFGRYLDSVCDRVAEGAFIVGAVIGGCSPAALLIVLGSLVQLVIRTAFHLSGERTNSAWFSRPERLAFIIIGVLSPAPYSTAIFFVGALLCLLSSAYVILVRMRGCDDRPPAPAGRDRPGA